MNYTDPSGHTTRKLQGFPPASQTKYKKWTKIKISVSKIKKQGQTIMAWGNRVMAVGGIIALKSPLISSVVVVAGGAVFLSGDYIASSINKFKNLCKFEMTTYFRWKTKRKSDYRYLMKTKSYVVCKNKKKTKRISKVKWRKYQGKAKAY